MPRPAPVILIDRLDDRRIRHEICKVETMYVVTYKGELFNMRRNARPEPVPVKKGRFIVQEATTPNHSDNWRYTNTMFMCRGFAYNMAAKLNQDYGCEDFAVRELKGDLNV